MTHGDELLIKCPACRKTIYRPLGIREVPRTTGLPVEFVEPCPNCHVQLRFWARWAVAVDCEKESKVY